MASIGKDSPDAARKDYALDKIEEASSHLLGVINDVLDMSKIEAGKLELVMTDFSFERVFKKAINAISFRMEQKQQEFYVTVDGSIPQFLISDDQRLTQVIINLLSNAVKFTPESGCIRMNAFLSEEKDGVCTIAVEIIDTGIGITPEQITKLFQTFGQADAGISRKFGGTGLGLAISKHIVEMMGGEISVTSEPGKGSKFTLIFKAERGSNENAHLLDPKVNWENVKILAVDDSAEILTYLTEIMKRYGVSCDIALSGAEALRHIKETGGYDMYFVDWKMPGMDGIELSREIKKTNPDKKSVVIMISSTEWARIHEEAEDAGVDKFLMKPLFASDIMDCMNSFMGMNGINDKNREKNKKIGELKGCCILYAEDVKINREILLARMKHTGAEIDCAENGVEAVRMAEENPDKYDMIFMDFQMPEMNGLDATRHIRQSGNQIPIIAMTANVFKEDIDQCIEAGMNDHIGKPLDLNIVLEKVRKYRKAAKNAAGEDACEQPKRFNDFIDFLPYIDVMSGLKIAGDKGLFVTLLNLFKDERIAEELIESIKQGGLTDIMKAAHKLRGAATNLGLEELFKAAIKIEADAKNGIKPEDASVIEDMLEKTINAINRVCEIIDNE
jgi:CheY-like chemotaxis protein/HPt (histidine-containing phosphotransfer) domain-containing protein/two-component sensor histidine kinase